MTKFGKKFPRAKAWWKQYKLKQKIKKKDKLIEELTKKCDKLEQEKRDLYHCFMKELAEKTIEAEKAYSLLENKKDETETTLQKGIKSWFKFRNSK
jgi:hypothetical protein